MKLVPVLCAVFTLPLMCAEGQSASPSPRQRPATAVTESFRAMSALFAGRLIQAFDAIPANRYDYAPTSAQQTVGFVAQHLVDANYGLCERFAEMTRPRPATEVRVDTARAKWPKDTLLAQLKASFTFCATAMSRVDDSKLADEVAVGPLTAGQTQQRARSLLLFVTDLAEHYSQVASYMRLIGLVPPSAVPPGQHRVVQLPAAMLARYVGTYDIPPSTLLGSPGLVLDVTRMNDELFVTPSSQPTARLWPESDTEFFLKEVNAQVTFTRNAIGAVTGLVLHYNGEDRPGTKIK